MSRQIPLACLILTVALAGCERSGQTAAPGQAWSRVETKKSPSARHDASMVLAEGTSRLLLFGGRDTQACLSDLWQFAPGQAGWSRVDASGGPSARSGAGLAWDSGAGRLILLGGYCHDSLGGTHFFGDLWFHTQADGWTREFLSGGPGPRAWNAMWVQQGQLIVFGGSGPAPLHHRNDVWALDLEKLTWLRLASDGGPLMPGRPSLVARPGQLTVLGQHGIPAATSAGAWNLDLKADRWSPPASGSGQGRGPSPGYHLAGSNAQGWLFAATGPGDARTGWDYWWTQGGTGPGWRHRHSAAGPKTPNGLACAQEPGQPASWICFGGVWREQVSAETWRFSPGSELRP